jgi:GT2 family glycosyltransferase
LLENPKRFTPQALNIGLSAATGEFIARMDAHTIYPPEYLQAGVDRLRLGDVDWVSGPQITAGDGPWSRLVALAMATPLGVGSAKFRSRLPAELEIDSNGFCGVWRRSTLERHQGWDEEWPINQDSELAARMRAAGERIVVVPEMAAAYLARDSPRTLIRQYWRYGQYRAKTCLRHPESMRRSHALPPLLAATLAGTAGPSRVARPARLAMLVYASTITVVSARAQTPRRRDRALLPVVLMSMHLAWGAGFIVGLARFARACQSTKP